MRILEARPLDGTRLYVRFDSGLAGVFDIRPYLASEAFEALRDNPGEFARIHNGGYFLEWACGADLSADTIEAHLDTRALSRVSEDTPPPR